MLLGHVVQWTTWFGAVFYKTKVGNHILLLCILEDGVANLAYAVIHINGLHIVMHCRSFQLDCKAAFRCPCIAERSYLPGPCADDCLLWLSSWLQDFKADVVLHFGMHGTVEWLPGAPLGNTGLSWSDVLMGWVQAQRAECSQA